MDEIRWNGFTHQEIYKQIWSGPGHMASADAQAMWSSIKHELADIDHDLKVATSNLGEGWDGTTAAETARNLELLGSWVAQAVRSASRTGAALDTQAEYVATLRNNMPPPPAPTSVWDSPTSVWDSPTSVWDSTSRPGGPFGLGSLVGDWQAEEVRRVELANHAVQVMETYRTNSAQNKPHIHPFATPITVTAGSTGGGGFFSLAFTRVASAARDLAAVVGAGGAQVSGAPAGGSAAGGAGAGAGTAAGFPVPVTPGPLGPGSGPVGRVPTPGGPVVPGPGVPGGAPAPGTVPGPGRTVPGSGIPGSGVPGRPGGGLPPADPIIRGPAGTPTGNVPGGNPGGIPGSPIPRSTIPTGIPGSSGPGSGLPGSGAPGNGGPGNGGPGTGGPPATGTGSQATNRPGAGYIPGAGMGAGAGAQNREHRRPSYLIDDTDAFGDDRWFTPAVITPFDVLPRR